MVQGWQGLWAESSVGKGTEEGRSGGFRESGVDLGCVVRKRGDVGVTKGQFQRNCLIALVVLLISDPGARREAPRSDR